MLYMLDTDTSIYIMKERPASLRRRFEKHHDEVCISVVTYAELLYGAERSTAKVKNHQAIDAFVQLLDVCDWTRAAAGHYAAMRAELDGAGAPIGAINTMIAAHARSLNAVVVTNNARHFSKVTKLKTIDWVES